MERLTSMRTLAVIVTAGLSLLAVIGDYFLKRASAAEAPFRTGTFIIGFVIYASTAFGTVFVFRHLKLATSGVVYAMCLVLMLTVLGVVGFRETLKPGEMLGIAMAIGSLVLLTRFA
jgi:small multidrug resistance pump